MRKDINIGGKYLTAINGKFSTAVCKGENAKLQSLLTNNLTFKTKY